MPRKWSLFRVRGLAEAWGARRGVGRVRHERISRGQARFWASCACPHVFMPISRISKVVTGSRVARPVARSDPAGHPILAAGPPAGPPDFTPRATRQAARPPTGPPLAAARLRSRDYGIALAGLGRSRDSVSLLPHGTRGRMRARGSCRARSTLLHSGAL